MKLILTLVAAFAATVNAYAQKGPDGLSFGEITQEEINMKSYAADTSANAVILFDIGSIALDDQLNARYKRHIRIKFFGNEDINEWATRTIQYETQSEAISKIRGATYNMENGKLVESKLEDDGIFKTKVDKVNSSIKFTLPNVRPGSIIEYSYTWTMFAEVPWWQFQHTIPTIYSQYETNFSKVFTFRKDMQGFLPLTDLVSKNEGSYEKLVVKDAPAFKVEPFITSPNDFVSAVHFYITEVFVPGKLYDLERTWPGIAKSYDNDQYFGMTLVSNGWLDKTLDPLLAGLTKPEDKVNAINNYVKANITWNEIVDRIPDRPLKKVLEDKQGSSSEINMLMIAMMRRAELDVYPVLISTRSNGIIRPFTPDQSQFNDVICMVILDGKQKLFDATDRTLPNNALPERCLNGEGLIVSRFKEKSGWVPLVSSKSRVQYTSDFKLKDDGELTGKFAISRDGLYGGDMRASYSSLGKEKYLAESYSGNSWEISNSKFENMDITNEMAKESHELTIRDHAQTNGDLIYINPYVAGLEENKFKSEKREYPVYIPTPFDKIYSAKFEIPAGYKVEELPANKMFVLPDGAGKFIYSATQLGNIINFTSQFSVTKNLITPDKYPQFREFYALVVAKQAEQIVLKKAQ